MLNFIATLGIALAADPNETPKWDYSTNGKDWPTIAGYEACGLSNQSPINLISRDHEDFAYPVIKAKDDDFIKSYSNQYGAIVNMNGHTSQVDLDTMHGANMFKSQVAQDYYGAPVEYNGLQFHFHAGSEHTVDGKRMDLEMHTVHEAVNARNEFSFAAMGVMFSMNHHTANLTWAEKKIIDTFFDGLKWDDATGKVEVDMVLYGNLMELVNMKKRWVYKGSVTTPPCARYIYWNVLSTIYPVSESVVKKFKQVQLNQGEEGRLDNYGNFRITQKIDEHDVKYVE